MEPIRTIVIIFYVGAWVYFAFISVDDNKKNDSQEQASGVPRILREEHHLHFSRYNKTSESYSVNFLAASRRRKVLNIYSLYKGVKKCHCWYYSVVSKCPAHLLYPHHVPLLTLYIPAGVWQF